MSIASLPWYDFPSTKSHLDSVYNRIRQHLLHLQYNDLPTQLDRQTPLAEQWANASLLLSQCCGPDLQTPAGGSLQVIARPVFTTLDCSNGDYYSHIVATSKKVGATPDIVVNSRSSFSGCTALNGWLETTGRKYKHLKISGSHEASLQQLLSNKADVAAINAYSWQSMNHDGLVVIGRSQSALAPPFVCHTDCTFSREDLVEAIDTAFKEKGNLLNITCVIPTDNHLYQSRFTPHSGPHTKATM